MKGLEITGRTVEEAIQKGLKKLGLGHKEVEIKILDEGKAGLFGLMGASPAKVKISQKKMSVQNPPNDISPVSEAQAKKILGNILRLMDIDNKVESFRQDEQLVLNIKTADSALLIEKIPLPLDSLQLLLNLIVAKTYHQNIILDTEDYRKRQKEKLIILAKNSAEKVKETKKAITLNPLPPHERKIIHLALQSDPFVQTASKGEGSHRRIIISLKNNTI
ncbi:Jag N-terminal domain-containing protein [bacterium]|nr:Jag N-terminal domain-containing protein [bacterium]